MNQRAMIVAGVMSGTSADGIDVAVVQIAPGKVRPKLTLLAHEGFPYPAALRHAVLAAMNAGSTSTAELARLNWRLGLAYVEAVRATEKAQDQASRDRLPRTDVVSPGARREVCRTEVRVHVAGGRVRSNCSGDRCSRGVELSARGHVRGRTGRSFGSACLTYVLFSDTKRGRVLQNIGGIANLTAMPAGTGADRVIAFDTGPGNMVIDALAQELFGKAFDRNGALAARGAVLTQVLEKMLKEAYFKRNPPRAAGREQYGREYSARFLKECSRHSRNPEDALATATALTAESIAESYAQFVRAKLKGAPVDYIVSGGGARNATLMAMLTRRLEPMGCRVTAIETFGMPAEAKEAAAFALLAWMTWHRLPGNIPAATGAKRPVILGQVTFA
jgi:anhydro-N-acetylmuramic acid kinase